MTQLRIVAVIKLGQLRPAIPASTAVCGGCAARIDTRCLPADARVLLCGSCGQPFVTVRDAAA